MLHVKTHENLKLRFDFNIVPLNIDFLVFDNYIYIVSLGGEECTRDVVSQLTLAWHTVGLML